MAKARYSLLLKVLLLGNGLLIAVISLTGFFTYRVARDALQRELIDSGRATVSNFARTNALEWLDPEAGRLNLQLRLDNLLKDDKQQRVVSAFALDREGKVLARTGQGDGELPVVPQFGDDAIVVQGSFEHGWISIATAVKYSGVSLGHVIFRFDDRLIEQAGNQIFSSSVAIILTAIMLNLLVLLFGMRRVLGPVVALGEAARQFARGNYQHRIRLKLPNDEIGTAAKSFNNMCDELELHMRFSNAALVDCIRRKADTDSAQAHQLTVIFGDAKGYTSWAEHHAPQEIFTTLTRYYTCFGRITVQRFGGIIDKFMGDGVMAHFGLHTSSSPLDGYGGEHVRNALRSTMYAQVALRALSYAIASIEGHKPLTYRFGIASGQCLVGAVGAKNIMLDYSPIGSVVNLAARLEAKAPPGGLVIDRFTKLNAGDGFVEVQDIGQRSIKGVASPIQIYAVRRFVDASETQKMCQYLQDELFDESLMNEVVLPEQMTRQHRQKIFDFLRRELEERPYLPEAGPE